MKTRLLIVLIALVCASPATYADQTPTVESHGEFVKIIARDFIPDVPTDRGAPQQLYIRRSSVERVSIMYSGRRTEYVVEIVTSGLSEHPAAADIIASYRYRFPNELSATAFCESLLFDIKPSLAQSTANTVH